MFNKPMHIYMYMLNLFGAIFTVKKRALFMKYFGASHRTSALRSDLRFQSLTGIILQTSIDPSTLHQVLAV